MNDRVAALDDWAVFIYVLGLGLFFGGVSGLLRYHRLLAPRAFTVMRNIGFGLLVAATIMVLLALLLNGRLHIERR